MASLSYPCYWMYKDNKNEWRWSYYATNGKIISVSSESYINRRDCEHSINLMKGSSNSPVWLPSELANAS